MIARRERVTGKGSKPRWSGMHGDDVRRVDPEEMAVLIEDGWRATAPKRVVAAFDGWR
jgi:hypothetical protein